MTRIARIVPILALVASIAAPGGVRADEDSLPPDEVLRLNDEARYLIRSQELTDPEGKQATIDAREDARRLGSAADATTPGDEMLAITGYDVVHYGLEVTPERTVRSLSGRVTVTLVVTSPSLVNVQLNSRMIIDAVSVEGSPRTGWSQGGGLLTIPICEGPSCPPHAPGDSLDVVVQYHSSVPMTLGYYNYPRNGFTFVEPYDAPYWWVCKDDPSDKATLDLYATVPDTNQCYSNGLLQSVTPATPGKSTWHWRETHPLATYLVSIAVLKAWEYHQSAGALPILSVGFPEDSTKIKADFLNVPTMITSFGGHWGAYAFDKYGQSVVDPFGGGMEHQTMTTLGRALIKGNRINEAVFAHELAHQWWGDYVTCASFAEIWLNEGFASYGEAQWAEDFYGPAAYASTIQNQMTSALNADSNFRYGLYNPPEANLFGTTIYKKGSLVLHMLRRILGDATFDAGMQLYAQRYAYGNGTSLNFQQAMEDASGQDLDWYFNPWVFDKGVPTYAWSWTVQPTGGGASNLSIDIRQTQTNSPFYRMPIEFGVTRAGFPDTTVTVWNEAQFDQMFLIPMAGTATAVTLDPRNSIYKRVQTIVGVPDPVGSGPLLALRVAPNPARGTVALTVTRTQGAAPGERTRLRIYDAGGRFVRELDAGALPPAYGAETVLPWDLTSAQGVRVTAGVYFAIASAGTLRESRPIVVVE
jgi:aminopeptidase N